jgi:iron complex outermembrane receptor protein
MSCRHIQERICILCFALLFHFGATAQRGCQEKLSGLITGQDSEAVSDALIVLNPGGLMRMSDAEGFFEFDGLCPGLCTLSVYRLGYFSFYTEVQIQEVDAQLSIQLSRTNEVLSEVTVENAHHRDSSGLSVRLNEKDLWNAPSSSFSDQLKNVRGVSLIRNGSGIGKPMVHGLTGNRLNIMNRGVPHSAQQWGNDHAPELDALSAQEIVVTKGVGSLSVPGASNGASISLQATAIPFSKRWKGRTAYAFGTNGRSHSLHALLTKNTGSWAWRWNASFYREGDARAPDYRLTNTGSLRGSSSLEMQHHFRDGSNLELFLSHFQAELGILRGAHIANLTDLQSAFQREEPFFTRSEFSYSIDAPRQEVRHELIQLQWNQPFYRGSWKSIYAFQYDQRNEFDIRRSGRTSIPALKLDKSQHFLETRVEQEIGEWDGTFGFQYIRTHNLNDPITGILPLIPDHLSGLWGMYFSSEYHSRYGLIEWGFRMEWGLRSVATIGNNIPRNILRYRDDLRNPSVQLGWETDINSRHGIGVHLGYGSRTPAVNERYSFGLHQGVASMEEGDPLLKREHSFKASLDFQGSAGRWSYDLMAYAHWMDDYIYLQAADSLRLTIRGAFPVFRYEQTDALIIGSDLQLDYNLGGNWVICSEASLTRGDDRERNAPLVFMPPVRVHMGLEYKGTSIGWLKAPELQLTYRWTAEQTHWQTGQDLIPPPPAYGLWELRYSFQTGSEAAVLIWGIRVENVTNERYRDYLDRLRYFSNSRGINAVVNIRYDF